MKKILLVMSVAILMALFSAPSFVKAETFGQVYYNYPSEGVIEIYCQLYPITSVFMANDGAIMGVSGGYNAPLYYWDGQAYRNLYPPQTPSAYIPDLSQNYTFTKNGSTMTIYSNIDDFYDDIPEEFRPVEPSLSEQRWIDFYDWFYEKFGYYPREGSLIDLIRLLAIGDWTDQEEVEITYPTLPPPTPTPTPIPVQTIFVPDGNGNTTIIYQYTDPTTGVITQSPYNPNIDIDVNCNCDGDDSNNIFNNSPTDPYTLTSSMLWADGFGVQITDNPLTTANDSQKSLAEAAAEYSDSVNVVSNSFNVLPFKWLMLVGLLGGILIIAGLIRTFLGG